MRHTYFTPMQDVELTANSDSNNIEAIKEALEFAKSNSANVSLTLDYGTIELTEDTELEEALVDFNLLLLIHEKPNV